MSMYLKVLVMVGSFFLTSLVCAESSVDESNYMKIGTLSGVEAEVIRVAVERFRAEKLEVGIYEYQLSISKIDNTYIVLFRNIDNAKTDAIYLAYDVEISAETLKVIHSQFSR